MSCYVYPPEARKLFCIKLINIFTKEMFCSKSNFLINYVVDKFIPDKQVVHVFVAIKLQIHKQRNFLKKTEKCFGTF